MKYNLFPTRRMVLIEKQAKTVRQIKCYLEQQLSDCSIYMKDSAFFYVRRNYVFLEVQIDGGGDSFLHPILFYGFHMSIQDIELKVNEFILKDFFQFDGHRRNHLNIKRGSHLNYVLQRCNKIK